MSDLLRSRLAVLDTETTGFPRDPLACVIDVGGVVLDTDGTEIASFSTLVRPTSWGPHCDEASKIHGITHAMLADAPASAEVVTDLYAWLEAHGVRYVTAFNVEFDAAMLRRMRAELRWAPCIQQAAAEIMGPAGALRDADPAHPRYDPRSPWSFPPLSPRPNKDKRGLSACEFFGVQPELPAHRALSDATTAARVLRKILTRRTGRATDGER